MKRILALLLCALLAALPVLAEAPEATKAPEEGLYGVDFAPRDGGLYGEDFILEINGESVRLKFDDSPLYSSIQRGLVQASYYAYGADGDTMYIMYMLFPDTAGPGMVLTPDYAALTGEECSVVVIVSTRERELYYFSSAAQGYVYPTDSDFSIAIDTIESTENGITYAGTLSASLVCMEMSSSDPLSRLTIPQTSFNFTIGGGKSENSAPGNAPLTDDMRKV